MPRVLCIVGLILSGLIALLFLLDLVLAMAGVSAAPFGGQSKGMDIAFIVAGGVIAYLSFVTMKENS